MQPREIEFVVGVETSTAPTAGTPSVSTDLITLGYLGTRIQEAPTGLVNDSNTAFTLSQTPIRAADFTLFVNGLKQVVGTDFTRVGTAITMLAAPATGQVLEADYRY